MDLVIRWLESYRQASRRLKIVSWVVECEELKTSRCRSHSEDGNSNTRWERIHSSLKGEESSWAQETEMMMIERKILQKRQDGKLWQMPCLHRQAMCFSLGLEKRRLSWVDLRYWDKIESGRENMFKLCIKPKFIWNQNTNKKIWSSFIQK